MDWICEIMKKLHHILWSLKRDRRGAVAIITAILFIPVILYCAGMPIDLARSVQLRSSLQNIADNAALAAAADLRNGATGQQACNLADAFVKASSTGLSVSYSSLGSPYAGSNAGYSGTNFTSTGSYSTTSLGCPSAAPHTDSLADVESTAPYKVTVAISTTLPTTFMSFARSTIPVAVSATSLGGANFITMCVAANPAASGDFNQLYYYAFDSLASVGSQLYNVGADGTTPATFSESTGAASVQFLGDDNGGQATYAITPVSPCASNQVKVYVHLPIATSIGFELSSIKGGLYPCLYAKGTCSYSNDIGAGTSVHYDTNNPAPANFYTDAYGTTVFSKIRFYSTDYPATLNTSTTGTASPGGTIGQYTPSNQYTVAISAASPAQQYKPNANQMYFNSVAGFLQANQNGQTPPFIGQAAATATTDLACLVSSGNLITDEPLTPYYNSPQGSAYYYTDASFTNSTEKNNVQQENLAFANSAYPYTNGSTTYELFQCPTTSSSSPYNITPTCAQLNGATLYGGWNDMGGTSDNVAYGDMPFTFSCNTGSGVPTLDYTRAVISQ